VNARRASAVALAMLAAAGCGDATDRPGRTQAICDVSQLPVRTPAELAVVHERLDPLVRVPEGAPIPRSDAYVLTAAFELNQVAAGVAKLEGSAGGRALFSAGGGSPEELRARLAFACGLDVPRGGGQSAGA
jgi:hypothetical protein